MHETMIYHVISCMISCPSLPANHPTIYLKDMQILEDMWYTKATTSREEWHDTYREARADITQTEQHRGQAENQV